MDHEYVNVIEKGAAYEYIVENEYKIGAEEFKVKDIVTKTKTHKKETDEYELTFEEKNSEGKVVSTTKEKMALRLEVITTYKEDHKICQNTLEPMNSTMEKYEQGNRYEWVLAQIEKDNINDRKNNATTEAYTTEDVALAVDLISQYYAQKFGLIAGAVASDFIPAGTLNESVVNYASQFDGWKLAALKNIDDLNVFFNDQWCAMFVSFCMKKASVPVPIFYGCSSFWRTYKSKPGFFDVAGAKNGGHITEDRRHIANLNQVQPGDILLFRWNGTSSTVARCHTGICKSIEIDSSGNVKKLVAIEGNTGGNGYWDSKVSIREYTGDSLKNIVSFVSISTVKVQYDNGNAWW